MNGEFTRNKQLVFGEDARKKMSTGVESVAKAVKTTLGAKGRNVGIIDVNRKKQITKDGVTVAESIAFKDRAEDFGAQTVIETASKTRDEAGDGTTTSIVLSEAIIREGVKILSKKKGLFRKKNKYNPILIKRGIEKAVKLVVEELKKNSIPVKGDLSNLDFVAKVSANNDKEIGGVVSEAVKKVGLDGIVTANGEIGKETSIKFTNGFVIDSGAADPVFIEDRAKMRTVFKNPIILLYAHELRQSVHVQGLIRESVQNNRPLIIICEDIKDEALAMVAVNKINGVPCAAIKNPFKGELGMDFLKDISVSTGAEIVSNNKGINIEDITVDYFGEAEEIEINRHTTKITMGSGHPENIENRIKELESRLKEDDNLTDNNKTLIKKRIGKLKGLSAIITVGGKSEVEVEEKLDRVDDALWASRSAIEEGIVPGGGAALIKAQKALNWVEVDTEDEMLGVEVIYRAIEEPLRHIVYNAGGDSDKVLKSVKRSSINEGWNALTEEVEDLIKSGIIDPVKVTRCALENASSVAGTLLTTECIVIDNLE